MTENYPFVTVIIPCRNEEKYIEKVLLNIIDQDFPKSMMEVYVVDGESNDSTTSIVNTFTGTHPYISLLNNPEKIVPHAMNIAIIKSRGEVIVRMDAHSEYPNNYISVLVNSLGKFNADNTGGVWITKPGASTAEANAIALAMSHPFGIGNASYRTGVTEPTWTDTVPFGCYKREVFNRIGLFDEQLIRNQDDELNGRLIKSGGKILLLPDVHIIYYARENLYKMSKMFYQYGYFKPLVNLKLGKPATIRQLFPPAIVISIIVLSIMSVFNSFAFGLFLVEIFLYLSMNIFFAAKLGSKKRLFTGLLKTFPSIHFSYGWGYLLGIWNFVFLRQHKHERKGKRLII